MRFIFDCDDDGHWYIVPLEKRGEFDAFIGNPDDYDMPDGVVELGCHPSWVSFENPKKEFE